ncbi:MAG: RNB domain-containing ribonuclease [Desulfobacteraceae bacterium]|nr:MAG: RNB domain-containing ribonuclease [Desulfobacteraceae bacterium]
MNQGKIIEYIDQGRFVCTLCLQDKGNRLHLLTASNREVNLSPKRVILISETSVDIQRPRQELLERLKRTEEIRKSLQGQVKAKELWELINEEKESFHHKYLAQLIFGEAVTDDHLSGLVRALFQDRLYFRLKDGRFLPNSVERVDHIVKQREEEALREERLTQGSIWLKCALAGRKIEDPASKAYVIQLLTQLALYGNEAHDFKDGKELLVRAEISNIVEARKLLVKLGVWDEDENLDFHRLAIEISFNKKRLDEAARLAMTGIDDQAREDLRHLTLLTIDGPLTRDFDDAISLEIEGDTFHLGVHISDVAAVIPPNSLMDKCSAERASSIYMPRSQIPMIPPNLSEDTLSLKQGCDRKAISLLARFTKTGILMEYRFVPSVIRVHQNVTYDMVNENLGSENVLKEMYQISHLMRENRNKQGALGLSLPELQVRSDADSSVILELVPQDTPSRLIVAEFMILYNWLAARFCNDNQIPILYRTQTEPSERLSVDDHGYLYYVFKQRRKINPLVIDTSPKPHSGLGLDVYTHATSPIRRYLDIVTQRQIGNALEKKAPFYDEKDLDEIRTSVGPVIRETQRIKRNRIRYWIYKFLRQHRGETYAALVLDELKNKYRILLTDFLLVAEIRREPHVSLNPADQIMVEVKKADPWLDTLDLAYAGGSSR